MTDSPGAACRSSGRRHGGTSVRHLLTFGTAAKCGTADNRGSDAQRSDLTATAASSPKAHGNLGRHLFSEQLISVELAGTLLLVALVGAVAIAMHGRPRLGERIEEALR